MKDLVTALALVLVIEGARALETARYGSFRPS